MDRRNYENDSSVMDDVDPSPFNDGPHNEHEGNSGPIFLERMTQKRPFIPSTWYIGPIDPEKIEDLELPDDQAEGKGHRYHSSQPPSYAGT